MKEETKYLTYYLCTIIGLIIAGVFNIVHDWLLWFPLGILTMATIHVMASLVENWNLERKNKQKCRYGFGG